MKKLIFFALALLMPTQALAWESTISAGYDHRHFDSNDQLGAVSPEKKLNPIHSSGFRLGSSILWKIRDGYKVGPEIWLSNGWVSAPHQDGYITKTVGLVDTGDLTLQSLTIATKAQIFEGGEYRLFAKPGFLVSNLSSGFFESIDTDTGAVIGLEFAGNFGKRGRFFVDLQALFSPSAEGPGQLVLSTNMVLGLQWVFTSEHNIDVQQLVSSESLRDEDSRETSQQSEVLKRTIELPSPVTPATVSSESKPTTLPPSTVVPNHEPQRVKGTLKLGADGKLDPGSYSMIDRVIEAHNQKPSIIKVLYKKDSSAQLLASEIMNYMISKGCSKEEITLGYSESLEKPIKISVISK